MEFLLAKRFLRLQQRGRAERHGGIFKDVMKKIISRHYAIGKEPMKKAAVVAIKTKNDVMRRAGFSPSQSLLGRFPRPHEVSTQKPQRASLSSLPCA